MSSVRKRLAVAGAAAAVVAMVAAFAPSASAAASTKCPSGGTPAPGSTITPIPSSSFPKAMPLGLISQTVRAGHSSPTKRRSQDLDH